MYHNYSSVVFAKEYSEVVSGTGRDLGDEIACGSEHFYLLSNENNKIRMLAKYNLYTGYIIDRVPKQDGKSCSDLAREAGRSAKSYYGYFSETIYVNEETSFANVSYDNSNQMFYNCISLKGWNGIIFNSDNSRNQYARIDTDDTPGYFTLKE